LSEKSALTLTLSPRRGNSFRPRWRESLNGACMTPPGNFSLSLGGEGRGEGERLISLNTSVAPIRLVPLTAVSLELRAQGRGVENGGIHH